MNKEEIYKLIETKLKEKEKNIRNRNAIEALFQMFPPASALWKVLTGSQESIALEKANITQDTILDIILAIDDKLETGQSDPMSFKILLDGVIAYGDVTGLKAKTSNPLLAQLFSDKDINVILKNIHAQGNVIGVDLLVDQELELKKKLHIETPCTSVDFNVGPNCKITFGKGLKPKDKEE